MRAKWKSWAGTSLSRTGPGVSPGGPVRLWGGPSGLLTPDLVLGEVNYGGEGQRILRVSLPGVLGYFPWWLIFPPDLQCFFDVIVCHWCGLVADNKTGPDVFGYTLVDKSEFFLNSDSGLIASTNIVWIQWVFNILISLFEWVGIRTNELKTVAMLFQPGPIFRQKSDMSY